MILTASQRGWGEPWPLAKVSVAVEMHVYGALHTKATGIPGGTEQPNRYDFAALPSFEHN
jgi:hypothetical protein